MSQKQSAIWCQFLYSIFVRVQLPSTFYGSLLSVTPVHFTLYICILYFTVRFTMYSVHTVFLYLLLSYWFLNPSFYPLPLHNPPLSPLPGLSYRLLPYILLIYMEVLINYPSPHPLYLYQPQNYRNLNHCLQITKVGGILSPQFPIPPPPNPPIFPE